MKTKFEQLKPGMVINMRTTKEPCGIQELVLVPDVEGKLLAVPLYDAGDELVLDEVGTGYCALDPGLYPDTLGIPPVFGDSVHSIYHGIGYMENNMIEWVE